MQKIAATLAALLLISLSTAAQAETDEEADLAKSLGRNYNLKDKPDEEEAAKPYILNVKNYTVEPAFFQKTAIKAFLKYRWKIETNEVTRVQGSYTKTGKTYKSEIRFAGDRIIVEYVPGFQSSNRKWLGRLANYVKQELRIHRREAEAQRYLKQ